MSFVTHLLKNFFTPTRKVPWPLPAFHSDAPKVTILYGSNSGNAEFVARETQAYLRQKGLTVSCKSMWHYAPSRLTGEHLVLMVISTYSEGVPPEPAMKFFQALHKPDMPALKGLSFAVCALGDSSYAHFCQAGKDLDERLHHLGAVRLLARTDCDSEYRSTASRWIENIGRLIANPTDGTTGEPASEQATSPQQRQWFTATIADRYALYNIGMPKECWHLSLKVDDAGFTYQPGDCLGIVPPNEPSLVKELLQCLGFAETECTDPSQGAGTLLEQLTHRYEITSLTQSLLERYTRYVKDPSLFHLLNNTAKLNLYLQYCDVLDMVRDFPARITPAQFLSLLNPQQHRLYSIATSAGVTPATAGIAVRSVKTEYHHRIRNGACSVHLNDRLEAGDTISVFVQKNTHFRLPENPDTPVIMIGTGTGVAPFRAFVQQRAASGARGKNWLLAGDHSRAWGYVYQKEFEAFREMGVLTAITTAFSRDGITKTYVQQSIAKHGAEIVQWLEAGAHLYVCGQRSMASDVHQSLLDIVKRTLSVNKEKAATYLHQLRREQRYCEDVY